MNGNNGSRVCIGIPSIEEDKLKLGQMLCQTFVDLGFSPTLVDDGNPIALESDVLLLVGDGRCFDGYAKLLGNCNQTRPLTILWLIDPLPPPQLSERGRQIGFKLAKCDWRRLPPPLAKLIGAVLPFSNDIQRAARWVLNHKIQKDAIANNCPAYPEIGAHEFFTSMTRLEWLKRNFDKGCIDYVFTTTIQRKQILKTIGIDAKTVPLGYHPYWGRKLSIKRDIDVLFIGALRSERRRSILRSVEEKLSLKGVNVVKINYGCYGEQRTALLNRAKIVLDILRIPWEMPGMRFLMSISCGALVICEHVEDTAPYKPGIHFVQAHASELSNMICYYLEHEDERQAIVDSAYKFVTKKLTLRNSISKIMQTCNINYNVPILK